MKSDPVTVDARQASGGAAEGHHYPQGYLQRLTVLFADLANDGSRPLKPLLLLMPPGMDGESLCVALLESMHCSFDVLLSGAGVNTALEGGSAKADSLSRLIVHPERLADGDLYALLEQVSTDSSTHFIIVTSWPFWLSLPDGKTLDYLVIGPRALRYSETEFRSLIEASVSSASDADAIPGALDLHNLYELTQGWPLISESAIAEVYDRGEGEPGRSMSEAMRSFSIAQLEAVSCHFLSQWLPLIESRYRWLLEASTLPLLNLDLLDFLFDLPREAVRECLLLGLLEPCPKNSGFYRINTAVDVLLLSVFPRFEKRELLDRAVLWYRKNGYPSEAVECLVSFVESDQLLKILSDADTSGQRDDETRSAPAKKTARFDSFGSASLVAKDSLKLTLKDSRLRWAKAIVENVTAAKAKTRQQLAPGALRVERAAEQGLQTGTPSDPAAQVQIEHVLSHIASAFEHHRKNNAQALSSSLTQAIDAGIDRQYLSQVIDFVDLHIRPLLQSEGSVLQMAIRDLKHSAPAREAVLSQYKPLNHRELQVLQRICAGYKNKEISEQLGLELSTIKWYSTGIYEKLQVRNRTQAVAKAQALKLFD